MGDLLLLEKKYNMQYSLIYLPFCIVNEVKISCDVEFVCVVSIKEMKNGGVRQGNFHFCGICMFCSRHAFIKGLC